MCSRAGSDYHELKKRTHAAVGNKVADASTVNVDVEWGKRECGFPCSHHRQISGPAMC